MESFDGSRRRDSRSPLSPSERRSLREPEPLEQRLDRWMSTGRQLVEGVSGARPGGRQDSRRAEGRQGGRGGFDGLGRWVENRLDWLLEDSDDWPEPWQQGERRGDPPPPATRPPAPSKPWRSQGQSRPPQRLSQPQGPDPATGRSPRSRRPLQAISRRGETPWDAQAAAAMQARPAEQRGPGVGPNPVAAKRVTPNPAAQEGRAQDGILQDDGARHLVGQSRVAPEPALQSRVTATTTAAATARARARASGAGDPDPASGWSEPEQDWPDDATFSVPRWQRPAPALRRLDPLQTERQRPGPEPAEGSASQSTAPARPLPRSSRRR